MLNIECSNIKDFCELICVSIGQGLEKQCVFASSKSSYPSIATPASSKSHQRFTYAFFTPLYTAIYRGLIKKDTFDKEYDLLKETCSKNQLYIHTFDKLAYNAEQNSLSIDTHIEVI